MTDSLQLQLLPLQQRPDLIHELALWHQQEWRGSGRSVPVTRRVQRLRSHLHSDNLPNTWLALEADALLGSVSLVDYVFHGNRGTSAWVANLYVIPSRRQQGLGRRLLAHAEAEAERYKLQRLFLFTPNLRDFYQQCDWRFSHQARVQGQWVDVMTKVLVPCDEDAEHTKPAVEHEYLPTVVNAGPDHARW